MKSARGDNMTNRWFNVGKIVNTHGIKGEVRVISKTDFAEERYKPGNTLYLFAEGRGANQSNGQRPQASQAVSPACNSKKCRVSMKSNT